MTPTRLTDAKSLGVASCEVQYSTKRAHSCDNSKILILEPTHFTLYDAVAMKKLFDFVHIGDGNEPIWSRTDTGRFYFHSGAAIYYTDVAAPGSPQLVRDFSVSYTDLRFGGKSDLSFDNNHIVVCGNRPDGTWDIFLFTIPGAVKGPVLNVTGFGNAFVTPDNNVLVTRRIFAGVTKGIELFNGNMIFQRSICPVDGHFDLTRDTDGSECIVWTNAADPTPNVPQNAIMKVRLSDAKQTPLLIMGWWPDKSKEVAVHITASPNGVVLMEAYSPGYTSGTRRSYDGWVWQLPLDGSTPTALFQHNSTGKTYDSQPRVSISGDGKAVAFNSDQQGTTPVNAYLVQLSVPVPPPPPPPPVGTPVTLVKYPNQQTLTRANNPQTTVGMGIVYSYDKGMCVVVNDGTNVFYGILDQLL